MRRQSLRAVLAVVACSAVLWFGVKATATFEIETERDVPAVATVARSVPQVAPRTVETKHGPLLVVVAVLVIGVGVATQRRRFFTALQIASPSTRVASCGWSRRGPPRHLAFA